MSHSVTPWTTACPGFPVHHQLPELAQTHVHRVGDSTQWSHPLSSSSPSAFNLSSIRIFSSESVFGIRWPKYWSFSISLSSEYSGLISFRMDWLDLLAVQGTLMSLLQQHSWKSSILWHSVQFSSVQSLSHVWLFVTPWITAHQASLSINSQSPPKPIPKVFMMPSKHLILCYPSAPALNLSQH